MTRPELSTALRDGDLIRVDAVSGKIDVLTEGALDRAPVTPDLSANRFGIGRELSEVFCQNAGPATSGAANVA